MLRLIFRGPILRIIQKRCGVFRFNLESANKYKKGYAEWKRWHLKRQLEIMDTRDH